MQFKPAVTALVSAVALASLLSGCKKEEAAPVAQAPLVGVVTIQPQAFTLTSELPGRTSAYRVAEVRLGRLQLLHGNIGCNLDDFDRFSAPEHGIVGCFDPDLASALPDPLVLLLIEFPG